MTYPVLVSVSHATRAPGSLAMMASSTASEIWSQILSGCPSVTDSEVKMNSDMEAGSFWQAACVGKLSIYPPVDQSQREEACYISHMLRLLLPGDPDRGPSLERLTRRAPTGADAEITGRVRQII